MRAIYIKTTFLIALMLYLCTIKAASIKGTVKDKNSKEALIGVTIQIEGSNIGTVTDLDGNYELKNLESGIYTLIIRYVSYKTVRKEDVNITGDITMDIEMEEDEKLLSEVVIVARRDNESEITLLKSRQEANVAIENMGAKEMSRKGISTVADGVRKLPGISIAQSSQLIVRGLGDRYSLTALNGMPIASPNPDNKLIPLDLFHSSTIQNITVVKVFEAGNFADYSGAYIDINTKDFAEEPFLNLSFNIGGRINTVFNEFYQSDKTMGLWNTNNLSQEIKDMTYQQFGEYVKEKDPFGSTFNIKHTGTLLPEFGGSISAGREFKIKSGKLGIVASLSIGNEYNTTPQVYKATYNAQGALMNEFTSDSYTQELNMASLFNAGFAINNDNNINYTLFYARNANDNYKFRRGTDDEGNRLIGSNSVLHVNKLLTNQIRGTHSLNSRYDINWSGSFSSTGSDEPDRRQVMYRDYDSIFTLFSLNQQETMRYFGELDEHEAVADIRINDKGTHKIKTNAGVSYKIKKRDYTSTRFYYNTNNLNVRLHDINELYNTDAFLNHENIANGNIIITKDYQPRFDYFAGSDVMAAFGEAVYDINIQWQLSAGIRFEHSEQWVRYWNDASVEKMSNLDSNDFFPCFNIKYNIFNNSNIRFSFSRTVTRPGFIEMAPFLYKESFGSNEIRGNENIENGYNYNIDLRYDIYSADNKNMFSITGYFKWLENPIERVQELAGGSAVNTFLNADDGIAAGVEIDLRKTILTAFSLGINASLIYTNVILPENGVYTDYSRFLQGASPYLLNADISYNKQLSENKILQMSLMYNLQGPRIHTVGINGIENVMQEAVSTIDFNGNLRINKYCSIKLKIKDLFNTNIRFTQKIKGSGEIKEVENYQYKTKFEIGIGINI